MATGIVIVYLAAVKLYDFWRSSSAWRVRIALHLKGVAFEQVAVDLFAGEQQRESFSQKNPMTQVPVLELDDGRRLTQSVAIIDWLETYQPEPPLFPQEPFERASAIALTEIINGGIQPLQNRSVVMNVASFGGDADAFASHYIRRGLAAFEARVAPSASERCLGSSTTIADVFLIPELDVARRLHVDLEDYPTLTRIEAACGQLPAFVAAHPDRQPGAPGR